MADRGSDFIRNDIGLAILGWVVTACAWPLLLLTPWAAIPIYAGTSFAVIALIHLGWRLAFPAGWRSGSTVSVLMVGVPVALLGMPLLALLIALKYA
ncbi:hypothetical protein [Nocardioides sp. BYT-33-1]|uniref:hypothetical protein n=1 Tax=Nocardioides sp. BYT-33-1 TaxID=3416952 RepID=UPI003F52C1D5